MEGQNNLETFFFLHMKPMKGLRENIYDLKYSLASLIIIVDEDGKNNWQIDKNKQNARVEGSSSWVKDAFI